MTPPDLLHISPVIKIITVFSGILIANGCKLPLGLALIAGGIIMDLWAGNGVPLVVTDFFHSLAAPDLWLLVINIALILEFGYFMTTEENSRTLIAAAGRLGGRHGRAVSLILIPLTIGLVPMPGGALFSAPLVGKAVASRDVPAAWKVAVNYWFRHVLEYWWPLYPVIIISLSIFSLPVWKFMLLQVTFTFVSIGAGWFFLVRPHLPQLLDGEPPSTSGSTGRLPVVLTPLLLIVVCTMLLPIPTTHQWPGLSPSVHKLLGMFTGLVLGIIFIASFNGDRRDLHLFHHLISRKTANILLVLAGAMIFQAMLRSSGLLPAAGRELSSLVIPVELIIAFLPFLAGLVTGVAIGFGATSFPLVIGLATPATGLSEAAVLILAFTMGYAGMMLSPIHLCYILTRRYFTVKPLAAYRYLVPCVITVMAYGLLFHMLVRRAGW